MESTFTILRKNKKQPQFYFLVLNLLKSLTSTLLQIGLLLPLLLLIKRNYSKTQKRLLLLAALVLIAEGLATSGLNFTIFAKQQWNWTGKTVSLIAAVAFVYFNPILSKSKLGFIPIFKSSSLYPTLGFGGIILLFRLILKLISNHSHTIHSLETFAFQATLPGLSEEIIYRGILLGLLTKVYPQFITIFKARIGWSVLIVSVLFGLIHGLKLDKHWQISFNSQKFCTTMGFAFMVSWLKQRSGSLWPAIIFHNFWNLIVFG
ncbi:MAG: CPBP family intramembrane metalloprotease [Sphingobacteriaceae bacterium]|nr:MAG: CPBP family intramembrane metalloprotease [Sphingobacteriaceae bacterium]